MNKHLSPRQVDLREAAVIINDRAAGLKADGIGVDVVARLRASSIQENDVVGVKLHRGQSTGRVMAFGGGWVDFEFSIPGKHEMSTVLEIHPIHNDDASETVAGLLDRLRECFAQEMVGGATS